MRTQAKERGWGRGDLGKMSCDSYKWWFHLHGWGDRGAKGFWIPWDMIKMF